MKNTLEALTEKLIEDTQAIRNKKMNLRQAKAISLLANSAIRAKLVLIRENKE